MPYLVPFLGYCEMLVENRAAIGVTPSKVRQDLWLQKSRVPELLYSVVCVIMRLAVLVKRRLVTDGRTNRRTQDDSIYRASIASRAKKW